MDPGLFGRLKFRNRVEDVEMGTVKFISFQQKPAIGTSGLGACSVVVIASAYGAILGHIPPRPPATSDPDAGDNNVRSMMVQIGDLYNENRDFFPMATTRVICAWFKGEVALPSQEAIMRNSLQAMALTPITRYYQVPVDVRIPGQGTVVVMSSQSGPVVYHDGVQIV